MSTKSALIGQHFAYASGRTGVLQQLLLSASDRDRLLGSASLQEAELILAELKLAHIAGPGLKKSDDILRAIGTWIHKEVETMIPESKQETFQILWLEEDAPMLSYLLKRHHGLTSSISIPPSNRMNTYDIDTLEQFPENLVPCIRSLKKQRVNAWKPEDIDHEVAAYVAALQKTLARTSGSSAIKQYVTHKIDLGNIRTALRCLVQGIDAKNYLLEGGNIPLKDLTKDRKGILDAINRSHLPYTLADALTKAADDHNAIEHALSKVIADDIAHMWNIPLSIEPVFAFAALAQSHMRLLRVLLIGKRAGFSPQEIKLMLPPFLSASHYVV